MSKKADAYVRFSSYNGQEKTPNNTPYSSNYQSTPNSQQSSQQQSSQQQSSQQQSSQQQSSQQQSSQQQQSAPHRVKEIDCDGLYSLLTSPSYQIGPDGKPMKILVKVHTDWCGPCKKVAPKIQELSNHPDYSNILFVGINGDKILDHPLKKFINVSAVPVFFGFVGGKKVDMIIGPDVAKIQNMCEGMSTI